MNAGPDDLTVQFATYHGLADYDHVYFVQRDGQGRPYAMVKPGSMPTIGNVFSQPQSGQYITCFLPDLSDIEWQTTLGSGDSQVDLSPTAFLVSDCEQVYISGWGGETNANSGTADVSGSSTFGLTTAGGPFQTSTDGSDFYLAVLAPDATDLVYATFFGGPFANEHVDGGSSRFDQNGTVYQSVCAGCGGMNDFPSTPGAWSPNNPSPNCNMGVFKFELGKLNAKSNDGPDQFCQGESVQFENTTSGPAAHLGLATPTSATRLPLCTSTDSTAFSRSKSSPGTPLGASGRHRLRHRHHCPQRRPSSPSGRRTVPRRIRPTDGPQRK